MALPAIWPLPAERTPGEPDRVEPEPVPAAPPAGGPGGRTFVLLAAAVALLVIAGAVFVWRPWDSDVAGPTSLPQSKTPLGQDVGVGVRVLPDGTEELVTVSITTGTVTSLKPSGGHDVRPVISQDRRTVVYLDRSNTPAQLRVVAADGTGDRALVEAGPVQGCGDFARPAWHSSTGTFVLVCLEADGTRSLRLFRLGDAARTTELLDIGRLSEASFLPDGSRIVYWKGEGTTDGGSIYTLDVTRSDTQPSRLTTSDSDNDPAVSPDGATVVFRRDDGGRQGLNLYSVPVAGGTATRLTSGGSLDESPAWSPDGARILFTCGSRAARSLCLVRPDGGGRRTVPGAAGVVTMAWSPR